jgi:hypothetical protein
MIQFHIEIIENQIIPSKTPDYRKTAGIITGPVPRSPLKRENNPPKKVFHT